MIRHRTSVATAICYTVLTFASHAIGMNNNQQLTTAALPQLTLTEAFAKATVVRKIKPEERLGACYTYAVTYHLGIIGKAPQLLKISTCINFIKYLDILNVYYQPTNNPQPDNLVVYRKCLDSFPTHFAILKKLGTIPSENIVESVWGIDTDVLTHKPYEVTKDYGTNICYYELKSPFLNDRNLFLKDLQQKVAQSPETKHEITVIQTMLLKLANGQNITSDTNKYFNMYPTIQEKAYFLLRICMGLSVNTFRASTKETVLMLATKRNDTETMKVLLSMGAETHRKDTSGNTALMIAEQAGYFNAVKLLKEYGATQ